MANGQPVRDDGPMELLISIGLCEESHTEGPKVGPQEEVEGVEGVGAPACMLQVVLTTKLTIRRQLHSTVVVEAIGIDLGVILCVQSKALNKRLYQHGTIVTMKPVMYVSTRSPGTNM